ncbi:uncharacterized protein MYCFIDRAFT_194965 [Pseudocercospora fijiensis CIRAD86]|uniref:Uncharacterized protein n=1 Tax=Pseudocercospora fijiensis (strain CIRAD86) TaxID=383855 RepID=M3BCU3_PSEFD|nr:uncharacterized protein MYCFIDRAFT_194965 [Pseudocercospora fijiensis CIRAD86]EME87097.1 hypothetical protein MYCFIDRAFT_194965 [Pseudocercospora fijiensis CIRAD86]
MDLAPDHFAYTDPQVESSTAAAARAKLVQDRIDSGVASIASTPTQDGLLEPAKQSLGTDVVTDAEYPRESLPEHRWDRGHVYKSSLACPFLCPWYQVCWQSQHTRPAVELLREVLEVRYPVHDEGLGARGEGSTLWVKLWRKCYRAGGYESLR